MTNPAKRVLIVEDDVSLARLLVDNLQFDGFTVEWVKSARDAIAAAKRISPDLVLLDVMLPKGMDGFELCRWFTHTVRRVPVIMLTARGQQEDRVRGLTLAPTTMS
jgi:DNA-binding response OmpR family regulator